MIEKLPLWNYPGTHPAFYEGDSVTAIEQTAKIHAKMNELIEDYNKFANECNTKIETFEGKTLEELQIFETGLRQEFQDFINTVDIKFSSYDLNVSEIKKELDKTIESVERVRETILKDIELAGDIVQTTGNNTTTVMSQKATTEAIYIKGKTSKTVNEKVIFLTEKDPVITSDLSLKRATLHGVNHFDLENASFTANSYSGSHTVTKENGGIKVVCTVTDISSYIRLTSSFIARFTGLMFCSCEADCEGDIRDIIFLVKVNGNQHTMCYGRGLLYQGVNVTEGDTVELSFYTHVGTGEGNTLYYKNIQCSYGGLYDYTPYSKPITNSKKIINLPSGFDEWYTDTTSDSTGGLSRFTLNDLISDMKEYPVDNDTIPRNVKVTGAELVPYNEIYQGTEGVGIANNGRITFLSRSVQSRNDLPTYLENNPITISYESTEDSEEYLTNFDISDVCQGKIVEFESAQKLIYYHTPIDEKKYKCVCFGDSITGASSDKTDYPSMMEHNSDMICYNVGFSGSRLTDHASSIYRPFSLNRLIDAVVSKDFSSQEANAESCGGLYPEHLSVLKSIDFSKVDFVTVFFGTNDWYSDTPLKSIDDTNSTNKHHTNVEDALIYSIKTLLNNYPHLRIVVISPYWRAVENGKDSDIESNGKGDYLSEFADYIKEISEKVLHLPTINLYRNSGVNVITNRYYTYDGTHPTETMKRIISKKIIEKIEEIK